MAGASHPSISQRQQTTTDYKEDTASLDNIMSILYKVISGEKGEERDWDRFQNLFYDKAQLIPSGPNQEGQVGARHMTPGEYASQAGPFLVNNGFFEREISREVQHFGNITHVWSTYESFRSKKDSEPFARGINSIQLLNDGTRWWIMNIYWTAESPDNPIPEKYLPD
jgi:hypothetical protein